MSIVAKLKLNGKEIQIVKDHYVLNQRPHLSGWGADAELYAVFTVNLEGEPCGLNQAYIDTNNTSNDDYQALIDNGIISERVYTRAISGYCAYPLHKILI